MSTTYRPIRARIDLAALRFNLGVASHHAGAAKLWSVVKANGYGHGLTRTVGALEEAADGFALVELEAAIALREAGIRQPILMMEGFYSDEELPLFAEYRLTPVVHRQAQVDALVSGALPARLPIYLKLNTGMNRLGLNLDEFRQALPRLQGCRGIASITLMSHFADADGPSGVASQMARFAEFKAGLDLPACLANSAALLRYPETLGHWARPGIMLYGSSPFPEVSAESLGLLPVMTLESDIIAVRELQAGDTIGYGNSFTADRPMRVGVVACGYADGYPRHAPTGTPVLVADRRTRTLGRVSMDKLCVDITELPHADVGAPVVLWGEGLSADDVASAAGTVSYELFCALAQRVPVVEA